MNLPHGIRERPLLYWLLLRCGLTRPGRALVRRMAESGWRTKFRRGGIQLRRDRQEIWFRLSDLYALLLADLGRLHARVIFTPEAGREVADLRQLAAYRIDGSPHRFWFPSPVCIENATTGYLLQGGPAEGGVVFDAGAFVGEFTIVAALRVGARGRVVAFEPDPANRRLLERNVREAGLNNVTICACGLWRESGEIAFAARGELNSCVAALGEDGASTSAVSVLGLAEAAARFGAPDFVKMDIEGAELEVIEGAAGWLRAHRPRFAIASYHLRDGRRTAERLEAMLRAAGYDATTGFPEHPTTWAAKR